MLLEKQDFNLNSCLEGVLDLCQTQAESKGLELGLLIDREVPRNLIGDQGRLRQVVTNLVSNGIKFTKTGGITIRAKISPHYKVENRVKILLEVEDTGIGIKQEDQDKLFKSFSQVDASITRQYGGTGLGLAISKQLVELMQGEIGFKSQEKEGSTFWFTATFTLSSKTELAEVDPVTPLSKKILQGKRLLIVDDRPINRQVVRHQLSHLGMTVEEAANGEEALAAVENAAREGKPYDLALVDIPMPQMDGETLGKLIREQPASENIKLIMMSSLHASNKAQAILGSGFADYLVKPIKETKLIQSLLQVLHSSVSQESVQQEKLVFSQSSEKLKILLVEDTPMNLQLAFNQLTILGYEDVDSATNGKEALDQLMEREYDLVLMDCQMPILDGYETTQTLRQLEKSRHTIVVGMTAYAMTGDPERIRGAVRQKCLDAGMDDYLSKPVAIKELQAVLERWSPSQQPQEEREEITIHPSPDVINWQKLEEIVGTDEKIQLQLLKVFINDATTYIEEVKAAISVKNWELIEKKAHQIKGISSSSAVESMATIAKEIEREAKARNSDLISRLVVELERVLDRAKSINNEQ